MTMSNQLRRPLPDHAPAERLARAIREIDRQIEQTRLAREPAPLSAYRARGILRKAHARCKALAETHIPQAPCQPAVRPDVLPKPHRSRRDPVERYEALPGPHHPLPAWQDVEDRTGPAAPARAYNWTGERARKENRLKLAVALLLGLAVALSVWIAIKV
jgi:hypothetical protein